MLMRHAQKACLDTPGALRHIIARGIERRKIFRQEVGRYDFAENDLKFKCDS